MKIIGRFLLLLALLCSTTVVQAGEHEGDKDKSALQKTYDNDLFDFININTILMWIANNGTTSHNPLTDGSGLEWPAGSAKYAIYEDGLVWGGKVQGEIRIGGSTYRHGLQAGRILADGSPDNPKDPIYRVYKVRKVDQDQYDLMTAEEQARLKKDFMEWPYYPSNPDEGAPISDNNNDGLYSPDFDAWLAGDTLSDTPWFIGDEVLWFIMNDLDPSRTSNLYGTAPIGVQVQTMVWGYNQTGPLGHMVFHKYIVINKGTDELEEAYFAWWSDPDLGDAGDDYVGIDTTLSLGFCYNGKARDDVYGTPPAAGYDFFQGPIVPGEPDDEAIYNFGKLKGWKNLEVSSFAFYINSDPVYQDPDLGTVEGGGQMYNYLTGKLYDGQPFIDPTSGEEVVFTLAGDPITKKGWIDGMLHAPDDRRMMMTTGPFTLNITTDLANGLTARQEVVVASIVGMGSDRISSLQVVKFYDQTAQLAFDNVFDLPKAPPSPKVVSTLQSGKVILSWGENAAQGIETFNDRGYAFEGYNVYQFPSRDATLEQGIRLATLDIVNNVATIFDFVIDPGSGAVVYMPVQFGTDSGIERYMEITNDAVVDRPMVNNQPYYFAVTSYSYNPDDEAVPHALESTPYIFEVRPRTTDPGYKLDTEPGEMLQVLHTSGTATGSVYAEVYDPELVTGHSYEVTFVSAGLIEIEFEGETLIFDDYVWNLKDATTGDMKVEKAREYDGLNTGYYTIDGLKIGLTGGGHWVPGLEILDITWDGGPPVYHPIAPGYFMISYDFFGSALMPWEVKHIIEVRFDRGTTSNGYVYLRGGEPSYGYVGYRPSPMTIWNVTDPDNEYQISYAFVENNGDATHDFIWAPDQSGVGGREYLHLIDEPYSDTGNPDYQGDITLFDVIGIMPAVYAGWAIQNADTDGSQFPWKDGDVWTWIANIPYDNTDVFTFTAPNPPAFTKEMAVEDVKDINVFPNPYYGSNEQELNKYQRFVTFNHLPEKANFRVFTVAGTLVASFEKNDAVL